MRKFIPIFLSVFLFGNFVLAQKLTVKGNLKRIAVGKGISCGTRSDLADFKKVGLVVNNGKDTLKTTMDSNFSFQFPPIKQTDIFQIVFFYKHSNPYLNRTVYHFPNNNRKNIAINAHSSYIDTPQLSNYSIVNNEITLHYALFCFIQEPYQPAGLDLYKFELQEAPYYQFHYPKNITLNGKGKSTFNITVNTAYKLQGKNLAPVYAGFSVEKNNVEKAERYAKELHKKMATEKMNFEKKILGKSLSNIWFEPIIAVRIIETPPTLPEPNESEQHAPCLLTFIVKNQTGRKIVFGIEKLGTVYNFSENTKQITIKNKKQAAVSTLKFYKDNPLNYSAQLHDPNFPNELFTQLAVYYGNKKIPVVFNKKWTVEQNEMNFTYTLVCKL